MARRRSRCIRGYGILLYRDRVCGAFREKTSPRRGREKGKNADKSVPFGNGANTRALSHTRGGGGWVSDADAAKNQQIAIAKTENNKKRTKRVRKILLKKKKPARTHTHTDTDTRAAHALGALVTTIRTTATTSRPQRTRYRTGGVRDNRDVLPRPATGTRERPNRPPSTRAWARAQPLVRSSRLGSPSSVPTPPNRTDRPANCWNEKRH